MKLKMIALLVPVFLLSLATAQAGEIPVPAPEVAAVAQVADPGCGAASLDSVLQVFTPAVQPEEPLLKAGCNGSYGGCQCFKLPGQSGCITSGSGVNCSICCQNLYCP
ncbi:MAG TPA: hypothetical protein VKK31_19615 [Thermoanaerobaculia bacterium]|nr:hypothetical protein [Thermoanaerobaculia bacterium]